MTPTLRLAWITILGNLAYVGLAVLGWGGFRAFFSHPARIALAIALVLQAGVALFSGGNLSPGEREDLGPRRLHARLSFRVPLKCVEDTDYEISAQECLGKLRRGE